MLDDLEVVRDPLSFLVDAAARVLGFVDGRHQAWSRSGSHFGRDVTGESGRVGMGRTKTTDARR